MNILVTGAKGMVGTALVNNLKNIRDNKNRTRPNLKIDEIYCYDLDSTPEELDEYCQKADFVFNLAGVNRPTNLEDFMNGNFGFASQLLDRLKKYNNKAPVMLSSSIQATCIGRYDGEYGRSKKAGEELFFSYAEETGAKVAVYRFPNLMGHSSPKYNSAVSTFCWAVANDEPFTVSDRSTEWELLYIDDLVEGMFDLLEGRHRKWPLLLRTCDAQGHTWRDCGPFGTVQTTAENADDAEDAERLFCKKIVFTLSDVSADGQVQVHHEDECGQPRQLYGIGAHRGLWTGFCQYQQTGYYKRPALAQL